MKKAILFVLILCSAQAILHAQGSVIKINVLSPIVRTINVSYEKKLSANHSFQMGVFYSGYSTGGTSFSGLGLTPEYRIYLSDSEAPAGVYVAPFVRYQTFTLKDDSNDKGTLSSFGGGLIIGKQWIFKEKVGLDMFFGPAYYSSSVKVNSGSDNFSTGAFNGFTLRAGILLGLAF